MAFGMQVSNGDFRDIIKYDARAGRLFRVDRDVAGNKTPVDITGPQTKFAIDFGSLEVGYVAFTASGPDRRMVPYGRALPPQPDTKDETGKPTHRPGFYVLVGGNAVGGVREWCSNAAILLNALDELYNVYAQRPEAVQGKIPVVAIVRTEAVTSGKGAQKSTNYRPLFEIVTWTDRMEDMGPRTVTAPAGNGDTLASDAAAVSAMTAAPAPAMAAAAMATAGAPAMPSEW